MEKRLKNIEAESVLQLKELVNYQEGQVVSKTLSQNDAHSITVFAFDKNEEISSHESSGDAMITALDGVGEITIDGEKYILNAGETIVMPAKKPHAVFAKEKFKMFLIVVYPS